MLSALNSGGFNLARIVGPSIAASFSPSTVSPGASASTRSAILRGVGSLRASQAPAMDAGAVPRITGGAVEQGCATSAARAQCQV